MSIGGIEPHEPITKVLFAEIDPAIPVTSIEPKCLLLHVQTKFGQKVLRISLAAAAELRAELNLPQLNLCSR